MHERVQSSAEKNSSQMTGIVSSGGRNFYWYSQRTALSKSWLICRDAYNGTLLWEKELHRPASRTLLVASGDRVFVQDLGSTNGTLVNGSPEERAYLSDQDELRMGRLQLRVRIEERVSGGTR